MKSSTYRARLLGKLHGRKVYRVPVRVLFNSSRACATLAETLVYVDSYSAVDAANAIRDEVALRAETEVYAYGPQGGRVTRYVGWESAIWSGLCQSRDAQLALQF